MSQLEVQIMGQSFMLGAPAGSEQQLREAVQRVDEAMCKIRDAGKVKARERIAVLAALNLAYDLVQMSRMPPPASQQQPSQGLGAADATVASAAVEALIARLDKALNEDGQLL